MLVSRETGKQKTSVGRGRWWLMCRYRKGLTLEIHSVCDSDCWLIFCKLGRLLFWNAGVCCIHVRVTISGGLLICDTKLINSQTVLA